MTRKYKLAANFNTVELEFTDDDLFSVAECIGIDPEFDEETETWSFNDAYEDLALRHLLQQEYDILASVKVVGAIPTATPAEAFEPASEKQIKWAKNLGMKNPEKASKKEVWKYIQDHKD